MNGSPLKGAVSDAALAPVILNPRIVVHGTGELPAAPRIRADFFGRPGVENRLITIECVVQRITMIQDDGNLLRVSQNGTPIDVYAQDYNGIFSNDLDRRICVPGDVD